MMSTLAVLLPPEPIGAATEFDYALSADGRSVQSHGQAPAALLPLPRGAGAEVVAVVPVQALSWHRVELPRGVTAGSPRLRAALEGVLEERLLDDPEALHFALQPKAVAGEAWVAACDRAWLRRALQLLDAADRPATRIVPEFAPEGSGALFALGEPERALLVSAGEGGVLWLPLGAASLPLLPALPEDAPRVAEPAVAALAEELLHTKLELEQPAQRWLRAAQSAWDLAQFEFASSSRTRALKKFTAGWADWLRAPQWRPARWAAVLLVAANLVGLNAWAWKERSALDGKREAIRQVLTTTFPGVKVVVDAPLQMEREVAALRQRSGMATGRDLESLLAALGSAVPTGRTPAALEFTSGELRVRGLGLAPDEFTALAANLKAQGYSSQLQGDVLVLTAEDAR
jgi:general secretion pathway protein L